MRIHKCDYAVAIGLLLFMFSPCVAAAGQTTVSDDVPQIILSGLDAYKTDGPEAAVTAWIKGSAIEGSKDALSQASTLRQVQLFYGTYKSFEFVHTRNISASTKVVYLIIDFEKGPMFAKFTVYKTAQGWILTSFNFNTKEELIFPASF
jgi:hypothetical protein